MGPNSRHEHDPTTADRSTRAFPTTDTESAADKKHDGDPDNDPPPVPAPVPVQEETDWGPPALYYFGHKSPNVDSTKDTDLVGSPVYRTGLQNVISDLPDDNKDCQCWQHLVVIAEIKTKRSGLLARQTTMDLCSHIDVDADTLTRALLPIRGNSMLDANPALGNVSLATQQHAGWAMGG
jgi:hypothetical protein